MHAFRLSKSRRLIWPTVLAVVLLWSFAAAFRPRVSEAASVTFTPVADAYVNAGSTSSNYGTSIQLRVDGSPIVNSYLRFTVANLSGPVTSATLRVYATSSLSAGYTAQAVLNNTWTESTINYTNAPVIGAAIGTSGAVSSNAWTSVNVTSYITGNGTFNLALTTSSSTALALSSRESGANAPQLIIQVGTTATLTNTQIPSPTVTQTPTSLPTATQSPLPAATQTATLISTPTAAPAATQTSTPTNTPMVTNTPASLPTDTSTPTPSPTATQTPPFTPTNTPTSSPTATQTSASDPVIVAAGDIACDPTNTNFSGTSKSSCQMVATANLVIGIQPSAALILGDNQYYCGSLSAYQQSYALSWGAFKSITHPAVGNHEYLTSGGTGCDITNTGAAGYFTYFGSAAGTPGRGYYSFDVGTWHLIALNSNCSSAGGCSSSSPQGQWLTADLAAHKNTCTLAYWHIPVWSSGGRASSNMATLTQILYNNNADLILDAHDHLYERFAPQNPQGQLDIARGIRSFVVGTGGANHTALTTIFPNSEMRNDTTFGVLKLTLHASSFDWQFVPVPGQTFTDSGAQACH